MANFKKGDVVCLKSGGPNMTIDSADYPGGKVLVKWFAGKKMESAPVDPDSIVLVDEGTGSE